MTTSSCKSCVVSANPGDGEKFVENLKMAGKRKHEAGSSSTAKCAKPADVACVIGIDFGTSRTGYAYAFPSHEDLIVCKEPGGQDATKTATSILLGSDMRFKKFGNAARRQYYEDADTSTLLCENFKMRLHDVGSGPKMTTAANGKKVSLMKTITETLRCHLSALQRDL